MNTSSDNTIFLRAFAAVTDEAGATLICQDVERRLSCHGKIARSDPPQRYWKIPEYWEVFVEFRPEKPVPLAFDDVLSELGSGWEVHRLADGGSWAVWNAGPQSTFVIPAIRWANLECLYRSDTETNTAE